MTKSSRGLTRLSASVLAVVMTLTGWIVAAPTAASAEPAPEIVMERVTVESFDGVQLGGWVFRPAGGAKDLPTVLISSPYLGQCVKLSSFGGGPCWPTPETPEDRAEHPEPVDLLVSEGYAVGWFSVRGTGVSGGCWEDMGEGERKDQKVLVEWLASQQWSNGNVGAMGISYMSSTALGAAVMHPKALKTVVVGGVVSDLYTYFHTPQGLAAWAGLTASEVQYGSDLTLVPAGSLNGDLSLAVSNVGTYATHICPDAARAMSEPFKGAASGIRDEAYWKERRLNDLFDDIDASVLITHGLQDHWGTGHKMQEDDLWSQIPTEKGMFIGQWGHTWPWDNDRKGDPPRDDLKKMWHAMLLEWLDHYLRDDGKGRKPSIEGRVLFEDDQGGWHGSRGWPLPSRNDETLYLQPDGALSPERSKKDDSSTVRLYPQADKAASTEALMCPSALDGAVPGSLAFVSKPVSGRTVVGGNPRMLLDLASDQPGGGFQVTMFDIAPDFSCDGGAVAGVRKLTLGGADLRFHEGNFAPKPFSKGLVRVDLANLATVLEKGHRLGLTISHPRATEYNEYSSIPNVTVNMGPRIDSSQLVIQVIKGPGFGGTRSRAAFPPRPI